MIVEIECTSPVIQCWNFSEMTSDAQISFWDKFLDGEDWTRNDIVAMQGEALQFISEAIFRIYAENF